MVLDVMLITIVVLIALCLLVAVDTSRSGE